MTQAQFLSTVTKIVAAHKAGNAAEAERLTRTLPSARLREFYAAQKSYAAELRARKEVARG